MSGSMKVRAGRIGSEQFSRAIPEKFRAPRPTCAGHHWHPIETGWECCHGGHKLRAKKDTCPPNSNRHDCGWPAEPEHSIAAWLLPPSPELRLRPLRVRRLTPGLK